jgi:hypothetical protein
MFNSTNWTLMDYIFEDDFEEVSFLNVIYRLNDISIYIPEEIIKTDTQTVVKYDYDSFINDLFNSFPTYEDITEQAIKDVCRSNLTINNINNMNKNNKINISMVDDIIDIMNSNYLSPTTKYTVLMLITQGVFGLPYNYVLDQYKDYHLGELKHSEKINGYNKMKINIVICCNKQKIKIRKKLRLFKIINDDDVTYKILDFTINVNITKRKIAFRVKEVC